MANAEPQTAAPLLNAAQVAERLNLSEKTVRKRMTSGELPVVRLGEGPKAPVRVTEEALEAYIGRRDELARTRFASSNVLPLALLILRRVGRKSAAPEPPPRRPRVRRKPAHD